MKKEQIAVILFTLRDYVKTPDGYRETIAKLADIGFKTIQLSGTPRDHFPAEEYTKICSDHGITICATHEPSDLVLDKTEESIEFLQGLGVNYTAYPHPAGIDFNDDEAVDAWLAKLQAAYEKYEQAGITLCYHNHDMEMMRSRGKIILDRIYSETSLQGELDTYWAQAGGISPLSYIQKMSGRMPLLHLKDYLVHEKREPRFAPIGKGNLEFDKIIPAAEAAGTEWFIIEQDQCYGESPFDCAAASLNYLKDTFCG